MPLFNWEGQPSKIEEHHKENARKLRKVLEEKRNVKTKWTLSTWAKEFRLLEADDDEYTPQLINQILEWYSTKGILHDKSPKIQSAKHFRKVFSWILELYENSIKTDVEITPKTMELASVLKQNLQWPKGSGEQLPLVIQGLYNKLREIRTKIAIVFKDTPRHLPAGLNKKGRETFSTNHKYYPLENALQAIPTDFYFFIQNYLTDLWRSLINWNSWNGNLWKIAGPESDQFIGYIKEWTGNYVYYQILGNK